MFDDGCCAAERYFSLTGIATGYYGYEGFGGIHAIHSYTYSRERAYALHSLISCAMSGGIGASKLINCSVMG